MRTCARCGHQNPETASTCESCHGLLTLQLHSGGAVQVTSDDAPPASSQRAKEPGMGASAPRRAMLSSTLSSISLKTAEYSPEDISFVESLSAMTSPLASAPALVSSTSGRDDQSPSDDPSMPAPDAQDNTVDLHADDVEHPDDAGPLDAGSGEAHVGLGGSAAENSGEAPDAGHGRDQSVGGAGEAHEAAPASAIDLAAGEKQSSADVGFSLAGASFRDGQGVDLSAQIDARSLRDPLLGQQVGSYRFVEKIGRGGFGAVYRAEHVSRNEAAAIKVLHLHQVDNPETVRRFQREARALAQLQHPNIVEMIDFGMLPQYGFYLVMELLEGDNIYSRLRARESFSLERLKSVFRQLCDVLHFVHERGIVHRDLKLSNIFLTPTDEGEEKLTLLDFGIASIADDIDPITRTGAYIGTATYASPEQIQGTKELDGRSDLYSLGVLLFRMLVGKPPFEGRNAMDITHRKLATPAPSLADCAPDRTWAPALEALMHSVLSREPAFRPPHAKAFWDECGVALDEQAAIWRQKTQIDLSGLAFPLGDQTLRQGSQPDVDEAMPAIEGFAEEPEPHDHLIQVARGPQAMISLYNDDGKAAFHNAHTLEVKEEDAHNVVIMPGGRRDARGDDPGLSIDPRGALGDTLDEGFDEDDSFATIRQSGLETPAALAGAMTLETPAIDIGSAERQGASEAAPVASDAPNATSAEPDDDPSVYKVSSDDDSTTGVDATIPTPALKGAHDTLVNPMALEDIPGLKEALLAQTGSPSAAKGRDTAPDSAVVPEPPAHNGDDSPRPGGDAEAHQEQPPLGETHELDPERLRRRDDLSGTTQKAAYSHGSEPEPRPTQRGRLLALSLLITSILALIVLIYLSQ